MPSCLYFNADLLVEMCVWVLELDTETDERKKKSRDFINIKLLNKELDKWDPRIILDLQ